MTDDLHLVPLDLSPNEASGLLRVEDPRTLAAFRAEEAFWTVLDETSAPRSVVLLARDGAPGADARWSAHPVPLRVVGDGGGTDDCEAVARHDGWVWLVGSHYGGKDGPLEEERQWVARFREEAATPDEAADLLVVRDDFRLWRLLNDALAGHALLPPGEQLRGLVDDAVVAGIQDDEPWRGRVRQGDTPLNVEGAAFRRDGDLLLGLRYPVLAGGDVLVVQLGEPERLFDGGLPVVRGVWRLGVGASPEQRLGVRDLELVLGEDGEVLHLLVGNLDSDPGRSVLLEDHPEGATADCRHVVTTLPAGRTSGRLATAEVRDFPGLPRVEGLARTADGRWVYVSDEEDAVWTRMELGVG